MAVGASCLAYDVIGYDDDLTFPSWCWIDPERDDALFWQYFSGKAWEIAAYVITVILYTIIKGHLIAQVSTYLAMSCCISLKVI